MSQNDDERTVGDETFYLSYDAENRLVEVSGAFTAEFVYDGDGNRVKATIDDVDTYFPSAPLGAGVGNIYENAGTRRLMSPGLAMAA